MEFLVEFEVEVPPGTPRSEVIDREKAESAAERRHLRDVSSRLTTCSAGHELRKLLGCVGDGDG